MRIAQIVASLEARHGGPSRSVLGVAGGLADLGHTVDLLTTEPGGDTVTASAAGLRIYRFRRGRPHSLAVSAGLCNHLAGGAYDLIHAHALWQRPLHYAATAARQRRVPLVISPRGMMAPWAWSHHRWKKQIAAQLVHPGAFAQAAGWHATSEEEAADIRRLGFTQPVCVAPNGVDIPTATERATAIAYWRAEVRAAAGRRLSLFHSRLHPKKRVLELIEMWASIAPADWMLLIVGIPEAYSIAQLHARARDAGSADRIMVFDGTSTPPPYGVAELFLLPTHSENFGLTVAEALANGIPVLTTDGTPWRRLNAEGAGRCVAWSDYPAALADLLAKPAAELAAQGAAGREWMRREFSWPAAVHRLDAYYRTLRGEA